MEELVQIKTRVSPMFGEAEVSEHFTPYMVQNKTAKNYVVKYEGAKGHISVPLLEVDNRKITVERYLDGYKATVWCTPEEVKDFQLKLVEALLGAVTEAKEKAQKLWFVVDRKRIEMVSMPEPKTPKAPKAPKAPKTLKKASK